MLFRRNSVISRIIHWLDTIQQSWPWDIYYRPVGTSNLQNRCHFWKRLMSIWHSLISILGWHGFESSLEVGFLPFWQKLGLKTYSMQIFLNAKFVKVCNRNGTKLKIVHRNHKVYKISRENIVMVGKTLYVNICSICSNHWINFKSKKCILQL